MMLLAKQVCTSKNRSMFYLILLLATTFSFFSNAQNMGYQFIDGYCQKNSAPGYNPNYKGECGMLTRQRLINTTMTNENLKAAILNGGYIYRSHFTEVTLSNSSYRNGYITESTFKSVEAESLDLRGSWIKGNTWTDSNLKGWQASGVRLEKTSFVNCDLQNANFWGANLQESKFQGSDLRGANLESTLVLFTKFNGSKFNSKTRLPFSKAEALNRGMVEVD